MVLRVDYDRRVDLLSDSNEGTMERMVKAHWHVFTRLLLNPSMVPVKVGGRVLAHPARMPDVSLTGTGLWGKLERCNHGSSVRLETWSLKFEV
jgi:hypothetical protein